MVVSGVVGAGGKQLVSIDGVPPCHQQRLYSQAICIVNRNELASRSSQSVRHETF